jgi:hypothetical protein
MIIYDMAKKPRKPPAPPAKRRRGRPPNPGGPTRQVEIQRAHRARLAAAGKVVRLVDVVLGSAATANPALASISGFDPATQLVCDRQALEGMRKNLHDALLEVERRRDDVARLETRNAYLERELKPQDRHHTNTLKEVPRSSSSWKNGAPAADLIRRVAARTVPLPNGFRQYRREGSGSRILAT